jgi:hypothetical protein
MDPVCVDVAYCPDAGSFGKFVLAVSGNCHQKNTDGYYGLDGITFGLLDFTANQLPSLFHLYHTRAPHTFERAFQAINITAHMGAAAGQPASCVDPDWLCIKNMRGDLNCDPTFHNAFQV